MGSDWLPLSTEGLVVTIFAGAACEGPETKFENNVSRYNIFKNLKRKHVFICHSGGSQMRSSERLYTHFVQTWLSLLCVHIHLWWSKHIC